MVFHKHIIIIFLCKCMCILYFSVCYNYSIFFDCALCRFGSGWAAAIISASFSCFLLWSELPLTGFKEIDPYFLRLDVFCINCATVGLSDPPPNWRCRPKNDSKGSWLRRPLRNSFTPGKVNIYLVNSTNEWTMRQLLYII